LSAFLLRPWLLFHPEVRNKYGFIFTNVKRKFGLLKEQKPQQVILPEENKSSTLTAGLVVIGVRPNLQQKGLGTILQQEFEAKARSMGAKRLQLSVRKTNQQAIKSYQRNGYTIHHELGPSFVMIKELQ
jgi:ribosomal protein S18 acetylase RimI-like enzyme